MFKLSVWMMPAVKNADPDFDFIEVRPAVYHIRLDCDEIPGPLFHRPYFISHESGFWDSRTVKLGKRHCWARTTYSKDAMFGRIMVARKYLESTFGFGTYVEMVRRLSAL